MSDVLLVRVNCPTQDMAHNIAEAVVGGRLAACANIQPNVRSLYRWDGELKRDEEAVLILKTHIDLWEEVERMVMAIHPDDTPAILAISCAGANERYEAWLTENCKAP